MIDQERFMTMEMLSNVLSEFRWPEKYTLEDDLPDGIIMSFAKSRFVFAEGDGGSIDVRFLPEDTFGQPGLRLAHAIRAYVPGSRGTVSSLTPGLVDVDRATPSPQTTINGIRNACRIMLAHLTPVIQGDFSWVAK